MSILVLKFAQGITTIEIPLVLPSTNLRPLSNLLVTKEIETKYTTLGGVSCFLGLAQTELVYNSSIKDYYIVYKNGSIY